MDLNGLQVEAQDVFDSIDVEQKGTLTKVGIAKAAAELGFPLSQAELQKAVSEMDTDKSLARREAYHNHYYWYHSYYYCYYYYLISISIYLYLYLYMCIGICL